MINENKRKSEPDLCAILDQVKDQTKTDMNCVSIGTIQSFNATDQTATIQLSYKRINLYTGCPSDYQLLVKCPVVVINGGGGYITFPIASGDTCLVLFCDREIDTWFTNGGINAPQSGRVHDLNDGVALIGIKNTLNSLSYYTSGIKVYYKNGYITIDSSGNILVSSPTAAKIQGDGGVGYLNIDTSGNVTELGTTINNRNVGNTGYLYIDASGNVTIMGASLNITNAASTGYININSSGVVSIHGTSTLLGAWVDKSSDYGAQQAVTDGFVVGWGVQNGYIYGYTDGNADPTTLRSFNGDPGGGGITMPVRKNDYWKVTFGPSPSSHGVYWIPIGLS